MKKRTIRANFIFISLKKNLLTIIFVLFAVGLIVFSRENLTASKEGLSLWMRSSCAFTSTFFYCL